MTTKNGTAKIDVLPPSLDENDEKFWTEHQKNAFAMASELKKAADTMGEKLRGFVAYCRANLEPKQIAPVLKKAGFPDSRVSEVKAIYSLDDGEYKPYAKGQIGWRPVLEKAREKRRKESGRSSRVDRFLPVLKQARRWARTEKVQLFQFYPLVGVTPESARDGKLPGFVLVVKPGPGECEMKCEGWVVKAHMVWVGK